MSAEKLNMNWKATAGIGGTLIFLMGFENLGFISGKLIENGMSESTPCAVVMRGTTAKQKKVVATLSDIKEKALEAGLYSPCIIVVGEVVKFNDELNWYERKPLFGRNICITRSKEQSGEMKEKLIDLGAQITEINSIKIKFTSENMEEYLDKLPSYDYIVFTSVNGVNSFFDMLANNNYDVREINGAFAAIGPATEKAIKERGIIPKIVAEKFVAESLFDKMKGFVKPGDKIFLPRSKQARPYLAQVLNEIGCLVDECYTYETVTGELADKSCFEDTDTVVFTSPSTVRNMIELVGLDAIKGKEVISIGPITGKELEKNGIKYSVCDEYTTNGVINKLIER
jgi:uroporphyrinogen III methyltransferase/synthase